TCHWVIARLKYQSFLTTSGRAPFITWLAKRFRLCAKTARRSRRRRPSPMACAARKFSTPCAARADSGDGLTWEPARPKIGPGAILASLVFLAAMRSNDAVGKRNPIRLDFRFV